LVFDREFSAQRWLEALEEAGCEWVVRLNTKSGVKITDDSGEEIPLVIEKGEKRRMEGVYYRGLVKVNVTGIWPKDQREPLWVMGSLKPDRLVEVYEERMKIEQTFKDSKSLLDMEKVMNKKRGHLEITLSLVLLAYGLGLMIGEAARDEAYGGGGGGGGDDDDDDDKREGDEKRGSAKRPDESGDSILDYSCC
jgi:Transposase DDE domain